MTSALPTHADLRQLRPQLLLALLAMLSGLALLAVAAYFHDQACARLASAETEGLNLQQRIDRFSSEEAELREDIRQYGLWADRGILGNEQRTKWTVALREKQRHWHLLALRYEFSPQQALTIPLPMPAAMPSHFVTSPMQLTATAAHEGQLIGFLDDLGTGMLAYVRPRRCVIERKQSESSSALGPLQMDCQMDWITVSRTP